MSNPTVVTPEPIQPPEVIEPVDVDPEPVEPVEPVAVRRASQARHPALLVVVELAPSLPVVLAVPVVRTPVQLVAH